MKSEEPPKTFDERLQELYSNKDLSDEQFEEQLCKILREKELDDNQIFALRNTI